MKDIFVVGSINMDLVVSVDEFAQPGETIHTNGLSYFAGGKGANQAVAAAKSEAAVNMIGAVGSDSFATTLLNTLKSYQVNTEHILQSEGTSGMAIITVNNQAENQILLNGGANTSFTGLDINDHIDWNKAEVVLLQNEIAWDTTQFIIEEGYKRGVPVWFNPAPAQHCSDSLLQKLDMLVLNETEAAELAQQEVITEEQIDNVAKWFISKGVKQVIITLGKNGCYYANGAGLIVKQNAFKVEALDTTAAGDTFIGSLAAALHIHAFTIEKALQYATAASALTVTKHGAQQSIPTKEEIELFLAHQ